MSSFFIVSTFARWALIRHGGRTFESPDSYRLFRTSHSRLALQLTLFVTDALFFQCEDWVWD
jgi:hypothetical protein